MNDSTAGNLAVVYDDETSEQRIPVVIIHHEGSSGLQGDLCDIVFCDVVSSARDRVERGCIDNAFDVNDFRVEFLGGEFDSVRLPFLEVGFSHPEDARFEAVGDDGRVGFEGG